MLNQIVNRLQGQVRPPTGQGQRAPGRIGLHRHDAGGPVQATTTLIYKIYREGFTGLDLASSAAQSVVLMLIVVTLTVIQFHYVEKKVQY